MEWKFTLYIVLMFIIDLTESSINMLQFVQNAATRVLTRSRK